MKKVIYFNELYDYYGTLLTSKQQKYYEDYYFNDLSLGEIADNENVSRNAIYNQLKKIEEKLEEYEEKLELNKKGKEIKELIKDLDEKTQLEINNLI